MPHISSVVLCSFAGQRRYPETPGPQSDSESELDTDADGVELGGLENSLLMWRFKHEWMTIDGPSDYPDIPPS